MQFKGEKNNKFEFYDHCLHCVQNIHIMEPRPQKARGLGLH